MIFLKLLITFFKIGMFSFGGGYAMIPFIEKEINSNGWLTSTEFLDILAIAGISPGPIAVTSATFVGYKIAGFFGGLLSTIGVTMPSFILILLISQIFFKYREHAVNKALFYGIRPVVAGLILSASILVAKTALLKQDFLVDFYAKLSLDPLSIINIGSIIVFVIILIILIKYKLHPIFAVLTAGVVGIVLYYVLPGFGIAAI